MAEPRSKVAILVIENDADAPIARLGDWLTGAGAELVLCRAEAGDEVPTELAGYHALVVLGGDMGANDDERAPWLPAVRDLLARAVQAELPTLGICLGGQLLAVATGGQVGPAETPEYGAQLVAKRQAAADDPLLRELAITPDVLQWHVDEIRRLPALAVLLASSPVCEVQAFRIGRLGWGTQFHLETSPAVVTRWAELDADRLADYDLAAITERALAAHDDLADAWQPIAERFVEIARDPAAAAGPRTLPMASASAPQTPRTLTDPAAIRAALAAELQASRGPHGH